MTLVDVVGLTLAVAGSGLAIYSLESVSNVRIVFVAAGALLSLSIMY